MELTGLGIASFMAANGIFALLGLVLGVRLFFTWRGAGFAEETHESVRLLLTTTYACVYSALGTTALYVLLSGLFPFDLMDRFATLLMSAGTVSLTATLLMATAGGDFTKDQARDAAVLLALPSLAGLLVMGGGALVRALPMLLAG